MHSVCALHVMRNFSFFHSISKLPIKNIINEHKIFFSRTSFPMDNIGKLNKDVLLYTFERDKFYKYFTIFGIAQFTAWSFYGGMMYYNMKEFTVEEMKKYEFFTKGPLWKKAVGEKNAAFYGIALCISLGILSTAVCIILPSRMIRQLTLCKGGKTAILVTYGPFTNYLKREVPLRNLSCVSSRSEAKSYLAVKVKPKWFYYLIDTRGKFHDPKLFDYTIGTRLSRAY